MIDVSICCLTYNQAEYIRDALDGFISQRTSYKYEVIVHDDASTDGTADIIREYAELYPDIIKPIFQTENQYSKHLEKGITFTYVYPKAKGKYLAICEGDDYWIDSEKLEKQISYMESHPNCTFCFSNGRTRYGDELGQPVIPWDRHSIIKKGQFDFNAGELELIGYIPTASFVYRRGCEFPPMPKGSFLGDTYIKLSMTACGYAHYFPEEMVVYRRNVSNSATVRWEKEKNIYAKQCDSFILLCFGMKEFTKHKYDDIFNSRITQWKIEKYYRLGNAEELKKIVNSGEIKNIKRGNLYSQFVFNMKCRHCKLFTAIRSFAKHIIKINK